MDQSVGAKPGATLPAPCAELPTGRELDIKFRTDLEGLKLALRSELLAIHSDPFGVFEDGILAGETAALVKTKAARAFHFLPIFE